MSVAELYWLGVFIAVGVRISIISNPQNKSSWFRKIFVDLILASLFSWVEVGRALGSVVLLIFQLVQNQENGNVSKKLLSTLNPAYSEEEINRQLNWALQSKVKLKYYLIRFHNKEREELTDHFINKKDQSLFHPSEQLKTRRAYAYGSEIATDDSYKYYQKMIEANISALNGKEIDKAREDVENSGLDCVGRAPVILEEDLAWQKCWESQLKSWEKDWKEILEKKDAVEDKLTRDEKLTLLHHEIYEDIDLRDV